MAMSFQQWQTLQESLGSYTLGVRSPHAVSGVYSNYPTATEPTVSEKMFGMSDSDNGFGGPQAPPQQGGQQQPMPMMPPKKKKHRHEDEFADGDEDRHDEFEDDDDEDHDHHDDDEDGDEEEDHDEEDEEGNDDDDDDMSDHPMGKNPADHMHDQRAFMKLSRESCGCDKGEEGDGDEEELLNDDDEDEDRDHGKEKPAFMMKKKMKAKKMKAEKSSEDGKLNDGEFEMKTKGMKAKKMKADDKLNDGEADMKTKSGCGKMCKKCKKMKAEAQNYDYYRRPTNLDNSDQAFMRSIAGHRGEANKKFDDGLSGMREDLLLPPDTLTPGQVGFAPQGRVGGALGQDLPAVESVQYLMKRLHDLEKKLKSK